MKTSSPVHPYMVYSSLFKFCPTLPLLSIAFSLHPYCSFCCIASLAEWVILPNLMCHLMLLWICIYQIKLSHTSPYGTLTPYKVSEKTNDEPIPRKVLERRPDRRMERWMDKQMLTHRTLLVMVRVQKVAVSAMKDDLISSVRFLQV